MTAHDELRNDVAEGEHAPSSDPSDECRRSKRVDGPRHSWRFDGDDPYVVCVFCGEIRDARTDRVIREAAT